MKYSILGKSDLNVSKIGFGCMSLNNDQKENDILLNLAIDSGINFFDTADLYENGENEFKLGNILKGKRHQVIIATKVGNQLKASGNGLEWNPGKAYILDAVDKSLQRLQTDYIDLYQLHGGTINDPIHETIEAFELLKAQGKIRYYGISSIRPNVIKEYIRSSNMVSVMMQYSLLDRRPEEECFALLEAANIGVISRGGLAQGLLVDKPAKPYLNWSATQVEQMVKVLHGMDGKHTAKNAVRFVLQNQAIKSAVIGIRTLDQLKDFLTESNFLNLNNQQYEQLRILPQDCYADHR
jgi:aryl-alcohol dehydrogenase-like predicted oxidoreductase